MADIHHSSEVIVHNVAMAVELVAPVAMEKELRFAIREGGRTVGAGVISEVVE